MEVILNSDIARLVLDYLRAENLDKAGKVFCKTSPHLNEEYNLLQKGLRSVPLGCGSLFNIIREHCEIKSKVNQAIESFPGIKEKFSNQENLLSKITTLLKICNDLLKKCEEHDDSKNLKRRRTVVGTDVKSPGATNAQDLPGCSPSFSKKRRLSSSYFVLNIESKHSPDHNRSSSSASSSSELDRVLNMPKSEHRTIQSSSVLRPSPDSIEVNSSKNISTSTAEADSPENFANINTGKKKSISNRSTQCSPTDDQSNIPSTETSIKYRLRKRKKSLSTNSDLPITTLPSITSSILASPSENKPDIKILSNELVSIPANDTIGRENFLNNSLEIDPNMSLSKLIIINENDSCFNSSVFSGDGILSTTQPSNFELQQQTNSQTFSTYNDQVLYDVNTGQISIPLYLTNENNYNMPVFASSSDSQFQETITLNTDKFEYPLHEQIIITAEQLEELQSAGILEGNKIKSPQKLLNSLMKLEKKTNTSMSLEPVSETDRTTPNSNTMPQIIPRSLSTPRRRHSHVRVLNFTTPSKNEATEPVLNKVKYEETKDNSVDKSIKPVETIASEILFPVIKDVNEGSNSNSLDFAQDQSNETVIHKLISETPKRKRSLRSCSRKLSHSGTEDDYPLNTRTNVHKKKNQNVSKQKKTTNQGKNISSAKKKRKRCKNTSTNDESIDIQQNEEPAIDPLVEWKRMRSMNASEWDQHLRNIAAKTIAATQPRFSNKRKKRKIGANTNSKRRSKILTEQEISFSANTSSEKEKENKSENKNACKQESSIEIIDTIEADTYEESTSSTKKKSPKKNLLNFKIPTPLKTGSSNGEKTENKKATTAIKEARCIKSKNSKPSEENKEDHQTNLKEDINENEKNSIRIVEIHDPSIVAKRTSDISHILDTPFKPDTECLPKTPRFLVPLVQDTPIIKQFNSFREPISSNKNPDIATPSYAITPGALLTPAEKDTPQSGNFSNRNTDYSSGSSYYKPDESDDLDKNFDAMLRAERAARKKVTEPSLEQDNLLEIKKGMLLSPHGMTSENVANVPTLTCSNTKVNLEPVAIGKTEVRPVECPTLLKRVKSFSDDNASSNLNPYYKFVEGLPETVEEEIDNLSVSSNSSSSSSSSTSSSSSSSSSNSSSASSSNSSSSNSAKNKDKEWKVSSPQKEHTSPLVADDGEIRYPVRSWLTPRKCDITENTDAQDKIESIKQIQEIVSSNQIVPSVMGDNTEEKAKQMADLEEKRLRMKQKLKGDFPPTSADIKKHAAAVRKKHIPNLKIQRKTIKELRIIKRQDSELTKAPENVVTDLHKNPMEDMLTALNLSAKKIPSDTPKLVENQAKNTKSPAIRRTSFRTTLKSYSNTKTEILQKQCEPSTSTRGGINRKKDSKIVCSDIQTRRTAQRVSPLPIKSLVIPEKTKTKITKKLSKDNDSKVITKEIESKQQAINKCKKNIKRLEQKIVQKKVSPAKKPTKKVSSNLNTIEEVSTKDNEQEKQSEDTDILVPSSETKKRIKFADEFQNVNTKPNEKVIELSMDYEIECNPIALSKELSQSKENPNKSPLLAQIPKPPTSHVENLSAIKNISEESDDVHTYLEINSDKDGNEEDSSFDSDQEDYDEEDADTYDICEQVTVDETDKLRYIKVMHNDSLPLNETSKSQKKNNLSLSVMNIFLDGNPHVITVDEEIELFIRKPKPLLLVAPKQAKTIPKKRHKHISHQPEEHQQVYSYQKEPNVSGGESSEEPYKTSTPVRPKINLKHYNRYNTWKARTEIKPTEDRIPDNTSIANIPKTANKGEMARSIHPVSNSKTLPTNVPESAPNLSPTSPAPDVPTKTLKPEDIFAVLSHLHGTDGAK